MHSACVSLKPGAKETQPGNPAGLEERAAPLGHLDIHSSFLSKTRPFGVYPTDACWILAGCPAGHKTFCTVGVFCRQDWELGAGNSTSHHPPSPLFFQWSQEVQHKEMLAKVLAPPRSRTLCQGEPWVIWSTLELAVGASSDHLTSHSLFTQLLKLLL